VQFVDEHLEEVADSALFPLDGKKWWYEAEDQWQALATCKEIYEALRLPDPSLYETRLPVHMDGSCNGLQHYAALGGDIEGGTSVNLVPSDRPQDVYSSVVDVVTKLIAADVAKDHPMAKRLEGKVVRKTIKQTVMTSVYGVTYIGARDQIANALKDQKVLEEDEVFPASAYIAKITFAAMQQMFTGARHIMTWLSDCATLVSRKGEVVTWTTPLGLPVCQPYRQPRRHVVSTLLQKVTIIDEDDKLPVSTRKQRSAFPPNYVHSLDSTHMFMTSNKCSARGIVYAAVHDSYWTHPCSVDEMNVALREAFVDLHSQPLLHQLLAQLQQDHPEIDFPPVPPRGDLDISLVLQSPYFFQ